MTQSKKFEIIASKKSGLASAESLLVVRGQTSYLRILGDEPRWELMTATASEDDGRYKVCSDRPRLIKAAARLAAALAVSPHDTKDWLGRDYVKICSIVRERHDEDVRALLVQTIERFFDYYDAPEEDGLGASFEMAELHRSISSGGDQDAVYLADGLWLSSNGTLHQRGR